MAPPNLRKDQHYSVRIFVNGQQSSRMDLPDQQPFTLAQRPTAEGLNSISTTLVGDGGESAHSTATTVTRDDVAPVIKVLEPTEKVYTENEHADGDDRAGRRHRDHRRCRPRRSSRRFTATADLPRRSRSTWATTI